MAIQQVVGVATVADKSLFLAQGNNGIVRRVRRRGDNDRAGQAGGLHALDHARQ